MSIGTGGLELEEEARKTTYKFNVVGISILAESEKVRRRRGVKRWQKGWEEL